MIIMVKKYLYQIYSWCFNTFHLLYYFYLSHKFVDDAIKENEDAKILFHCLMGISRSCSLAIAYYILSGLSFTDAFSYVNKHNK